MTCLQAASQAPDLKIPTASVIALLEQAAAQSQCPDFGLRMAQARQASVLGAVGLIVREQPDVRHALRSLIKYMWAQAEGLLVRLEEEGHTVVFSVEIAPGLPKPAVQTIELALASLVQIVERLIGPGWLPEMAVFAHARPRHVNRYTQIFGHVPIFGHERNALVLDASTLDREIQQSDPETARQLESYLRFLVGERHKSQAARVRDMIQVLLPRGECRIDRVAQLLGVDRRTVHRRLAAEGISFSELVQQVRQDLLETYSATNARSLTETSQLLGFSSLSSFSRWRRLSNDPEVASK